MISQYSQVLIALIALSLPYSANSQWNSYFCVVTNCWSCVWPSGCPDNYHIYFSVSECRSNCPDDTYLAEQGATSNREVATVEEIQEKFNAVSDKNEARVDKAIESLEVAQSLLHSYLKGDRAAIIAAKEIADKNNLSVSDVLNRLDSNFTIVVNKTKEKIEEAVGFLDPSKRSSTDAATAGEADSELEAGNLATSLEKDEVTEGPAKIIEKETASTTTAGVIELLTHSIDATETNINTSLANQTNDSITIDSSVDQPLDNQSESIRLQGNGSFLINVKFEANQNGSSNQSANLVIEEDQGAIQRNEAEWSTIHKAIAERKSSTKGSIPAQATILAKSSNDVTVPNDISRSDNSTTSWLETESTNKTTFANVIFIE